MFRHLPIATADEAASHVNQAYRDWLAHPRANDPYWDDISFESEIHNGSIPILVVDGWYDIFLRGALEDDIQIRRKSLSEIARRPSVPA